MAHKKNRGDPGAKYRSGNRIRDGQGLSTGIVHRVWCFPVIHPKLDLAGAAGGAVWAFGWCRGVGEAQYFCEVVEEVFLKLRKKADCVLGVERADLLHKS